MTLNEAFKIYSDEILIKRRGRQFIAPIGWWKQTYAWCGYSKTSALPGIFTDEANANDYEIIN